MTVEGVLLNWRFAPLPSAAVLKVRVQEPSPAAMAARMDSHWA